MGEISFWYLQTIWLRKKLKNLVLKKHKILGLAQNCIFSAVWLLWFFVHNSFQNHPNWICWGSLREACESILCHWWLRYLVCLIACLMFICDRNQPKITIHIISRCTVRDNCACKVCTSAWASLGRQHCSYHMWALRALLSLQSL